MGLFKNIFGTSESSEKMVLSDKTIFDLIQLDFKNIPDNTFQITERNLTEEGNVIVRYRKEFPYGEFVYGIFRNVQVNRFTTLDYNISFLTDDFYIDLNLLEKLVNDLYMIYGEDDCSSGKFSSEDRTQITNGFWTGRMYSSKSEKLNKHHVMLSGNGEYFDLTIFSPNRDPGFIRESLTPSLIDKLKDLGVDFELINNENSLPSEISIDEELGGKVKKVMKILEDNFFNMGVYSEFKDGSKQLFLLKEKPTERDFKNYTDNLVELLGLDWMFRDKFTKSDLNRLRGEEEPLESFDLGLRQWNCETTRYRISLGFTDDKDLSLFIYSYDNISS